MTISFKLKIKSVNVSLLSSLHWMPNIDTIRMQSVESFIVDVVIDLFQEQLMALRHLDI